MKLDAEVETDNTEYFLNNGDFIFNSDENVYSTPIEVNDRNCLVFLEGVLMKSADFCFKQGSFSFNSKLCVINSDCLPVNDEKVRINMVRMIVLLS